jgi:hypothetical protein
MSEHAAAVPRSKHEAEVPETWAEEESLPSLLSNKRTAAQGSWAGSETVVDLMKPAVT